MRLPDHIYNALKPLFAQHADWHVARMPEHSHLRGPGTHFPGLQGLNQAGSGEQFLRFHREMVRIFKWVLANTPGPAYPYTPWPRLPDWVANLFESSRPGFLAEAYQETNRLVIEGTADELGNFIEATRLSSHPVRGIHNRTHGTVAAYERQTFGVSNPLLVDAQMDSSRTAPHNEHFWGLHGWIDEVFAEWQRLHNEIVDQSPLDPVLGGHGHGGHPHHEVGVVNQPAASVSVDESKIFKPIWEE
ncbi:MAG: tyrosinase family protein [Acidobacteriota bacterium]|nr:tyrosinase family protein [Acidobacteriota bacterium]